MKEINKSIILLIFCAFQHLANCQTLEKDSLILVEIYDNLNGENWINQENWLTDQVETWHGVQVENGRVTYLSIYENNQNGIVPNSIWSLDSLNTLSIQREPGTYIEITSEIGNLKNLRNIQLYWTKLLAPLPDEFYSLTNLSYFHLHAETEDSLIVSPKIKQLTNLNTFTFENFSGPFPSEINEMEQLVQIYLRGEGGIYGGFFPEIDKLQKLRTLMVYGYEFDNNFLESIYKNANLNWLYIHRNSFKNGFQIPENLNQLTKLDDLSLVGLNFIDKSIPLTIFEIPNLTELTIYPSTDNNLILMDSIPSTINSSKLEKIALNYLGVSKMPEITLSTLKELDVEHNKLDFDDLERNMHIASFNYDNQDAIGDSIYFIRSISENIDLTYDIQGTKNNYIWLKDGEQIEGNDINLFISEGGINFQPLKLENAGEYQLKVSSDSVPGLELQTIRVPLNVTAIPYYRNQIFEEDSLNLLEIDLDSLIKFAPEFITGELEVVSSSEKVAVVENSNLLSIEWPKDYYGSSIIQLFFDTKYGVHNDSLNLIILPINDPPVISSIADTIVFSSEEIIISFEYYDVETITEDLSLTLETENDISIGEYFTELDHVNGIGEIHIIPYPNLFTEVIFNLSISDGELSTTTSFQISIQKPLSIPEEELNVILFPIPSEERLYFSLPKNLLGDNLKLSIIDISGKTVFNKNIYEEGDKFQYEIDISFLRVGKYYLNIETSSSMLIEPFLKK